MKNAVLALGMFLAAFFTVQAQDSAPVAGGPEITFEKDVHDFGNMKQHGDASTAFNFTNTGTEPLVISNAKGSCGCTVPEWPRDPIMPGQTSAIKVKYDSKRIGPINKSVTITSNAVTAPTKVIRIKGNIAAAPAEQTVPLKAAPAAAPTSNN